MEASICIQPGMPRFVLMSGNDTQPSHILRIHQLQLLYYKNRLETHVKQI